MKPGWKKISKRAIYSNPPWSSLEGQTYERPDGSQLEYTISVKNEIVMVFAVTLDNKALMLRQYYFFSDETAWNVVTGFIEDGETPLDAAKKELREEAGAAAKEFVYLGSALRGKYSTGEAHMYLAFGAEQVYEQELDPSEDIETHIISFEECQKLLQERKIREIYPELCTYRALAYLGKL